jgi:hypothetical protein
MLYEISVARLSASLYDAPLIPVLVLGGFRFCLTRSTYPPALICYLGAGLLSERARTPAVQMGHSRARTL